MINNIMPILIIIDAGRHYLYYGVESMNHVLFTSNFLPFFLILLQFSGHLHYPIIHGQNCNTKLPARICTKLMQQFVHIYRHCLWECVPAKQPFPKINYGYVIDRLQSMFHCISQSAPVRLSR